MSANDLRQAREQLQNHRWSTPEEMAASAAVAQAWVAIDKAEIQRDFVSSFSRKTFS